MATRTARRGQPEPDPAAVLVRLRSPDPRARVKALHSICPCDAGFPLYERFRAEVKRLQKDPDPAVRAAALHVERDAYEIEIIEAGLAQARLDRTGQPWEELEARYRQDSLGQVRAHLGTEQFDQAHAEGMALSFDEALDLASGKANRT